MERVQFGGVQGFNSSTHNRYGVPYANQEQDNSALMVFLSLLIFAGFYAVMMQACKYFVKWWQKDQANQRVFMAKPPSSAVLQVQQPEDLEKGEQKQSANKLPDKSDELRMENEKVGLVDPEYDEEEEDLPFSLGFGDHHKRNKNPHRNLSKSCNKNNPVTEPTEDDFFETIREEDEEENE